MPRVLVETVSAGGGSIAWVDDGGALRVGPHSAGVVPGPVAFGRGGTKPTVTDAHVALRRIAESRISGGISLNMAAARESVRALASMLSQNETRTAQAVIATADATMARALRRVSIERGIDPRTCTLIAFGGGGPLHACGLAELVGIERVLVPPHAGVLSALGLAITVERREAMGSVMRRLDEWADAERAALLDHLASSVATELKKRSWLARVRYVGQGHELDVPTTPKQARADLMSAFIQQHARRYGFTLPYPAEIVSVRHVAEGTGRLATLRRLPDKTPRRVRGPASIVLPDATLWVDKGWNARLLESGAWLMEQP
jgi:N-methylhydantoinase A